jgi:hypothetical protein
MSLNTKQLYNAGLEDANNSYQMGVPSKRPYRQPAPLGGRRNQATVKNSMEKKDLDALFRTPQP